MPNRFKKLLYKSKQHYILLISCVISLGILLAIIITIAKKNSKEKIFVPIIMYHNITTDDTMCSDNVITPTILEKDLIYLQKHNYTTIKVNDLVNYVEKDIKLPQKPVILTFDDGFYSNLSYVLPLLEKYNMTAVVSIIGDFTEETSQKTENNLNNTYLSYKDIIKLKHSERIEFSNQSYKLHYDTQQRKGAKINPDESIKDYKNIFIADTMKTHFNLIDNCNITPQVYTFPYGYYCDEATQLLKGMGYKVSFTCKEKPNYITKDPNSLFYLNRYNRPADISTKEFMKKALKK